MIAMTLFFQKLEKPENTLLVRSAGPSIGFILKVLKDQLG